MRLGWIPAVVLSSVVVGTAPQETAQPKPDLAPWVEPDFPFYSSVLDARNAGVALPKTNLSPRAIVLNLGQSESVGKLLRFLIRKLSTA